MNNTKPFSTKNSSAQTSATPSAPLSKILTHPQDVLAHPEMTSDEKRALLASWASDARVVENSPGLRQLDSGAVVSLEQILEAIKALDLTTEDRGDAPRPTSKLLRFARIRDQHASKRHRKVAWLYRRDNDDDPPAAPAAAAISRPVPILFAYGGQALLTPAA